MQNKGIFYIDIGMETVTQAHYIPTYDILSKFK